ncbi:MAG: HAMP domain-containing histidine kinase [Clostridia bacterium]|nr:HAMP domain-containing histidine kinase [Clostridia bacterium]
MKNKRRRSTISVGGMLFFFFLIAFIMQVAILVFDYIEDRTSNNGLIAVLVLVLIFILSTVCTIIDYFRRKIMVDKPVKKILDATEKITAGDFSARLDLPVKYNHYNGYDAIMEDLNKMAEALEKSAMLRTDFISNVSHELKTPLAVIQSYSSMLQNEELDSETRQKYVATINNASRRLTDLITNILKLNKLENQDIAPEYERVDLTAMLSDMVLSFESIIEKKELNLECDLDDVVIYSSGSYLEIVWNNLISNAIKFTDKGGSIFISLKEHLDSVEVKITDTGCGISRETGKHIFEKFYQGDTSHSGEGNGLGLPLVKKVIDILGGEISVKSEIGKGSTFTIILKGTGADE